MKVLFVCVKNSSRSPIAEALLKMSAKRAVKVCSAGIKPGKEVNDQAVKAMREVGYDLSGHKPRHISHFADIKFDYVAKMERARSRRHGDCEMDRRLEHTRPRTRRHRRVP